jgi:class 3 adenylate cyclase
MKSMRETIGPYCVVRELGSGPNQVAFEVEDPMLFGARRALKLLRVGVDFDRIEREAKLLSTLSHPNLVSIHGFGIDDETGCPFYTMDLFEGGTMRGIVPTWKVDEDSTVSGNVRSVRQILQSFDQVLGAVAYLHSVGLVHRAISPDTILMSNDGVAVLSDVGLARRIGADARESAGVASLDWMNRFPADERSDLFSIGITMFEVLSQVSAFEAAASDVAPTLEQVVRHLAALHEAERELALPFPAAVPEAVRTVIRRAARLDPADRQSSARELRADLLRATSGALPGRGLRRLAAVLSADSVEYTTNIANDPEATAGRIAAIRSELAVSLPRWGGRLVDFVGDEFMAEFSSTADAVNFAADFHATRRRTAGLAFRIGIDAGDVRVDEDRLYGNPLNLAARLRTLAEPGRTCVSDIVERQLRNEPTLDWRNLGEKRLKHVAEPVRVFAVEMADSG